jgi:putative radical SAM enzyme (TIGR03279 family)
LTDAHTTGLWPLIKVTEVQPGSIGEAIGLVPDTDLISIDGTELEDFLDWEFLSAEEEFSLVYRPPGEDAEFEVQVERPIDDPIGVAVEPPRIKRCANRCDFCFVEGNPEGVRQVLYIRDDDYRLSFRYGNFATLTNLKQHDIDRIIRYRLSPLYVSVHATDPQIRRWVLRNPQAPDILPQLRQFADHGIEFHTQIVMAPQVNDGAILRQTLDDLWNFGPAVLSVSVVPVGLTEYSKHHLVREPDVAECRAAIDEVERAAERALAERGVPWAQGADELYIRADRELPPASAYGSFDQVENGVGSVRWLQQQVREGADTLHGWEGKRIAVLTGTAMSGLLPMVLAPLEQATGATFELIAVENDLFGPRVTTAGLLSGGGMTAALRQLSGVDLALLPGESVNDDGLFIDSVSVATLAADVPMPVRISHTFVDALSEPLAA